MSVKQLVIFKLGNEEYGIDISKVNEISQFKESNKIPNSPDFISGIINLRGDIIPMIDLKIKFNICTGSKTDRRVIVTNIKEKKVGFVVDEASEVLSIMENDIDPPPELISREERQYITGIGKLKDRIIIILDLEKILTNEQKKHLNDMNIAI